MQLIEVEWITFEENPNMSINLLPNHTLEVDR